MEEVYSSIFCGGYSQACSRRQTEAARITPVSALDNINKNLYVPVCLFMWMHWFRIFEKYSPGAWLRSF